MDTVTGLAFLRNLTETKFSGGVSKVFEFEACISNDAPDCRSGFTHLSCDGGMINYEAFFFFSCTAGRTTLRKIYDGALTTRSSDGGQPGRVGRAFRVLQLSKDMILFRAEIDRNSHVVTVAFSSFQKKLKQNY